MKGKEFRLSEEKNSYRLDKPTPLTKQSWEIHVQPMVSVSCITYMHASFIRDAIEGFLMQKTNFPVEILIHDDASTDGTAEIIKEYEKKYPRLIKCFCQPINTYRHPDKNALRKPFKDARRGKYIAICEGDDYWTDPLKLQRQVDFLERNPQYGGIAENAIVIKDNGKEFYFGRRRSRALTMKEIIRCRQFATASFVFRNDLKITSLPSVHLIGDTPLMIRIQKIAPIYYNNIVSSVYRRGKQGITSNFNKPDYHDKLIAYNQYLDQLTDFNYSNIIEKRIKAIKFINQNRASKHTKASCISYSSLRERLRDVLIRLIGRKQIFYFDLEYLPFYAKIYYRIFG